MSRRRETRRHAPDVAGVIVARDGNGGFVAGRTYVYSSSALSTGSNLANGPGSRASIFDAATRETFRPGASMSLLAIQTLAERTRVLRSDGEALHERSAEGKREP